MRAPAILALSFAVMQMQAGAEPTAEVVYNAKAAVVKVHVITNRGGHGVGSGVVVAENLVATNCHVLANSSGINIASMGDIHTPVAVKEDWRHDVCILKFKYLPLKPVTLGDSEQLQYEQSIFSIGFPGGPPKPQATYGNIKALYPFDDSFIIRTSSSFVMGASGSPLMDDQGRLIGLSTFKSPGRNGYFYNVSVKWVKLLLDAPESEKVRNGTPFWDVPEDQRPYFMRVVIPMQNEEWGGLKQISRGWVENEPNNAEALYYLGLAEDRLGESMSALQHYNQAIKLNPRHSATVLALARIAHRQGDVMEVQRLAAILKDLDHGAEQEFVLKQGCEQNKPC